MKYITNVYNPVIIDIIVTKKKRKGEVKKMSCIVCGGLIEKYGKKYCRKHSYGIDIETRKNKCQKEGHNMRCSRCGLKGEVKK